MTNSNWTRDPIGLGYPTIRTTTKHNPMGYSTLPTRSLVGRLCVTTATTGCLTLRPRLRRFKARSMGMPYGLRTWTIFGRQLNRRKQKEQRYTPLIPMALSCHCALPRNDLRDFASNMR